MIYGTHSGYTVLLVALYTLVVKGYIKFVWICTTIRGTWYRGTFNSSDRLKITFCIDLSLSLHLSVRPSIPLAFLCPIWRLRVFNAKLWPTCLYAVIVSKQEVVLRLFAKMLQSTSISGAFIFTANRVSAS